MDGHQQTQTNPEFVVFGSKHPCSKLEYIFPVNILGTLVKATDAVKTLWYGLMQSLLSQDMYKPSASLALSTSGIFADSDIISHKMTIS